MRKTPVLKADKNAPIFEVATFGIVGDLFQVVPGITNHIRQQRAAKRSGGSADNVCEPEAKANGST